MAITNAQQYKQLVNPPMKGKKRPGYRGDDAAYSTGAAQMGRADPGTRSGGPSGGPSTGGRDDIVTASTLRRNQLALENAANKKGLEQLENLKIKSTKVPSFIPASTIINAGLGATEKFRQKTLDKNVDFYRFDPRTATARQKYGLTAEGYQNYMSDRLAGNIDAAGNLITNGEDNNILLPVDTTFAQAPSNMNQGTETQTETETDNNLKLAFRANGGRIGAMGGGIMGGLADGQIDEMGRQMYGLGKLVKKATRAVKKIVQSPIGKAALLYTGAGALSNLAAGSGLSGMFTGFTNPSSFLAKEGLRNIFTKGGLKNIAFGKAPQFMGPAVKGYMTPGTSGLFGTGGELSPLKLIGVGSAVSGAITSLTEDQEEEAQFLSDTTGIDIEQARNSILAAAREQYAMDERARGFKADGGIMRLGYQEGSKEPVAKKTMPLLDMGGKEMDLRENGGFVPLGRMEKADDVPARLSKNEFVFTADAVRNAGDGNVDKGAEVMYNMMKNLESGGDVSEESQGLEGARQMFQTSQRLEEVI